MVKIALQIRASLENVTGLRCPEDDDSFQWFFKLKCSSCGEVPDHWQDVSASEEHELKGGRGSANAVIRCKLCSRENSMDIVPDSTKAYDATDPPRFKSIVAFDCRGLEPVDFSPRGGWVARGIKRNEDDDGGGTLTGTVFEDVDLTDKDWADYDDASGEGVCISELEHQFVKIK